MPSPITVWWQKPDREQGDHAVAAVNMLRPVAFRIVEKLGVMALLDGLISVWIDLMLSTHSQAEIDDILRKLRRELPRMAVAKCAARSDVKGSA